MTTSEEGAQRAALAVLSANGGFDVVLRIPGQAVSGSDAEQLGLGTPQFQDVPIGPAVWRKAGKSGARLVGAAAVTSLMGVESFSSAESLFQAAVGVVVDEVLYLVAKSEALMVVGVPCAYRLTLQEPTWI